MEGGGKKCYLYIVHLYTVKIENFHPVLTSSLKRLDFIKFYKTHSLLSDCCSEDDEEENISFLKLSPNKDSIDYA